VGYIWRLRNILLVGLTSLGEGGWCHRKTVDEGSMEVLVHVRTGGARDQDCVQALRALAGDGVCAVHRLSYLDEVFSCNCSSNAGN